MINRDFKVGLTGDFVGPDGKVRYGDIRLDLLDDAPGVKWDFLDGDLNEISPSTADQYDALVVLEPRVSQRTFSGDSRLSIVSRFGVGYDSVDLDACTDNGVIVSITPDASRRPVSTVALMLLLATGHKLLIKDRMTRDNRWDLRGQHMGVGVTGRTLGIVGLGNIGRDFAKLVAPLEMNIIAADPYVENSVAADLGVTLVELDELVKRADFVVVTAALTEGTRGLIGAAELAAMKPTAFLINVARGPIVDQVALTAALSDGALAGAGLDVFDKEPPDPNDPILKLDNVTLGPHGLTWTDEAFRRVGETAIRSVLDVAAGRLPPVIVNRAVAESPALLNRLSGYRETGS